MKLVLVILMTFLLFLGLWALWCYDKLFSMYLLQGSKTPDSIHTFMLNSHGYFFYIIL
jgi:hypothetical protein